MFQGCQSLISLDISNFNTPNVESMKNMFDNCSQIEYLNFRNINSMLVISMDQMFYQYKSLKYLNLFSLTEVEVTINMFEGAAINFTYCINSPSNIPNIISYLNE